MFREKFNCNQCEYVTLSIEQLKIHVKDNHGTKGKKEVERCECHCGKVFDSNQKLKRHAKYTHFLERKHICTICSKAFGAPNQLRVCMTYQNLIIQ